MELLWYSKEEEKNKQTIEYVVDTDFQLDCSKGFCLCLVLVKLLIVSLCLFLEEVISLPVAVAQVRLN